MLTIIYPHPTFSENLGKNCILGTWILLLTYAKILEVSVAWYIRKNIGLGPIINGSAICYLWDPGTATLLCRSLVSYFEIEMGNNLCFFRVHIRINWDNRGKLIYELCRLYNCKTLLEPF
jgi:hypothetical protein